MGSRLVAGELAQETFLVAYRDWGRISRLDNPRAWVRRVAINQRGSFLRAYLRQQTRERDAAVRYEDDPHQAGRRACGGLAGRPDPATTPGPGDRPGRAPALPQRPQEPPGPPPPLLLPPARPRRTPQRLALVVNLLLVLGLGIVLGVAATDASKDANGSAPVPAATTIASQACRRASSP